jgi:hypothetical protein
LEGVGFELVEQDSGEEVEEIEQPPSKDLHSKAVWCVARLRNCGWLEDLEIGYEEDARTAICPQVVPILQAFYSIINPQTVTYSGKLNKAYQLLAGISTEDAPYENILKEVGIEIYLFHFIKEPCSDTCCGNQRRYDRPGCKEARRRTRTHP